MSRPVNDDVYVSPYVSNEVIIDQQKLAKTIQKWISDPSRISFITVGDISVPLKRDKVPVSTPDEFLLYGGKPWDMILWNIDPEKSGYHLVPPRFSHNLDLPKVSIENDKGEKVDVELDSENYIHLTPSQSELILSKNKDQIKSIDDRCKRLFWWHYAMLMFRGDVPDVDDINASGVVPKIVRRTLTMDISCKQLRRELSDMAFEKLPKLWIRYVTTDKFAKEVLSRLLLGLPGYRVLAPFKFYPLRKYDASVHKTKEDYELVSKAYKYCQSIINAGFSWDVFPLTRTNDFLAKHRSLNKGVNNLMLLCFEMKDLEEMASAESKMIYKLPKKIPGQDEWRTWATYGTFTTRNLMDFATSTAGSSLNSSTPQVTVDGNDNNAESSTTQSPDEGISG